MTKILMLNKRKVVYAIIIFVVILATWFGGYLLFINSEKWSSIKSVIKNNETVITRVGRVQSIKTSLFGVSYRFSGTFAHASLKITVIGEKGVARFKVEIEKSDDLWRIIQIKSL